MGCVRKLPSLLPPFSSPQITINSPPPKRGSERRRKKEIKSKTAVVVVVLNRQKEPNYDDATEEGKKEGGGSIKAPLLLSLFLCTTTYTPFPFLPFASLPGSIFSTAKRRLSYFSFWLFSATPINGVESFGL